MAINAINGITVSTATVINGISGVDEVNGLELSGGGGGGFAMVAHFGEALGENGGTSSTSINTTGANLIVMVVGDYGAVTASVVSDSKGNTWNVVNETTEGSGTRNRIFYTVPSSVGSGHTFTATGTTVFNSIAVAAFSGANASPADQDNGNSGTAITSLQTGSVTPSVNNSLIVTGATINDVALTPGVSGYTLSDNVNFNGGTSFGSCLYYKILAVAAAENPTWTFSSSVSVSNNIATFKPA